MPDLAQALKSLAIYFVPLLLGIVCHEVAHGWVAYRLGDPTAKNLGRLTLNPVRHFDPTGAVIFLLTTLFGPFVLGWAKPVPIHPGHFKNPTRGMALVSAAGPAANLILAVIFAFLLRGMIALLEQQEDPNSTFFLFPLALICKAGVDVNIILAVFNLLPVPPLDGSKIVAWLLPDALAEKYLELERFGFLILIVLLATGLAGMLIQPAYRIVRAILL
jgi:Zn-dependent protease